MAGIVIQRLFNEYAVSVAIHGGVFASSAIVRKQFERQVNSQYPRSSLLDREVDPVRGALDRARREFKAARYEI
jgi:hypothetical protein